jgi:integrase
MSRGKSKGAKSSTYQRKGSPYWWIRRTVPGLGEIRLSTRTTSEKIARRYDDLVCELRERGRMDALTALKKGEVSLLELHENREAQRLADLLAAKRAPLLEHLLTEWMANGAIDMDIRESSMHNYRVAWKRISELGLITKRSRLSEINDDFVYRFKKARRDAAARQGREIASATINRDLAAIGAFLSWCEQRRGLVVSRPKLKYLEESSGRIRWLTREECRRFKQHCPEEWWPLFALLFATGMTISEALGLTRADIDLETCSVSIHEEYGRKLKRKVRKRDLSFTTAIVPVLQAHLAKVDNTPLQRVFATTRWPARKAWVKACEAAGIVGATIHDARHTFAVHAVQRGVPEARLQSLLGHSHPATTRKYAMHAPEQFVKRDAETVSGSLGLSDDFLHQRGPTIVLGSGTSN